ncbi:hypothetical protein BDA96_05G239100 [Sorghum bicolor]|uniref:Knottin scorpion toxin-like domain-containing protein n=1 Tax=Sorghum bicolor TaxID=4558 RepID=A0A921QZ66_SORBI|nr:hypothetical protein BDA96_05G239100 [Sorghum bicolor]
MRAVHSIAAALCVLLMVTYCTLMTPTRAKEDCFRMPGCMEYPCEQKCEDEFHFRVTDSRCRIRGNIELCCCTHNYVGTRTTTAAGDGKLQRHA